MKIRSKEQLIDCLDGEIAWRKKELFNLRSNVEKSSTKLKSTAIRAGLVLLYAHWEGFIKRASEAYLEYVINQKLNYGELSTNFMAISIKQRLKEFEQSNKATLHNQIVDFILSCNNQTATINKDNAIKTQSNLNSVILREIMTSIGLDFSSYETKSNLIDEQLLNYRNTVAHGQHLEVDDREYISLHDEVNTMIERFKTDIENAALLSRFSR